jgi:hypothetical protein
VNTAHALPHNRNQVEMSQSSTANRPPCAPVIRAATARARCR